MAQGREVVVVSGVRTAVGGYGGMLKDKNPSDLAAQVTKEAVKRSGLEPSTIGHVVFGNVIHTAPKDMYLARVAAVDGGLPHATPAFTLNRLCGSGMNAIVSAAQLVMLGDCDAVVAGGAEVMSSGGYWLPSLRWGKRMGDAKVLDATTGALTDPFHDCHMGMTAENLAAKYDISREEQDELAVESHRRAAKATEEGLFKSQILPVEVKQKRDTVTFDTDEHVRSDASPEGMAKLKPVFDKEGTVTAGNAAGLNDAASAVVMMEAEAAKAQGVKPTARLVDYAFAGVDPKYMGIGPVPVIKELLEKTGLSKDDLDVIELNEAFAAQALAVIKELDLPVERTNPNGSGISLGHPIGATGCLITVKALYELERIDGRYALVTMCIGGGQGIGAIFERMER